MFLLSNFILRELDIKKPKNVLAMYSIVLGLVIYASVYLYILFYHKTSMPLFNNLLIYILSLDLILSGVLYNQSSRNNEEDSVNDTDHSSELLESELLEDDLEDAEDAEDDLEEDEVEDQDELEDKNQDQVEAEVQPELE
jgi:hypothetical protein